MVFGPHETEPPFQIDLLDEELNKKLLEDFKGERDGFVQVGPQRYLYPKKFLQEVKNLYNFQVRPSDTWVVTFPRSGTTWTQELVWLIANDLNFEKASQDELPYRFPYFEGNVSINNEWVGEILKKNQDDLLIAKTLRRLIQPMHYVLNEMAEPRFIKTHLPISLLPPNLIETGCKVIYVARNPKDVAVSLYHLNRSFQPIEFHGDLEKFWVYFERNLTIWSPYWSHVIEGWNLRNHPNVLFLFYEDMNKDLSPTIKKMSQFLGKSLTEEQEKALKDHLHINKFRDNPSVNCESLKNSGALKSEEQGFIRKGKTGGWAEEFTPELNLQADKWICENLRHTDLRFPGMFCSVPGGN